MKTVKRLFGWSLVGALVAAPLSAGCSGDDETASGSGATSAQASSGSGASQAGGAGGAGGGSGGTASGGGGASAAPYAVTAFDPGAGQLPEGLAVRGGVAYVGFAPTGAVASVDLGGSHAISSFGALPPPPPNGFVTGLAFDAAGALYGAMVSSSADVTPGVYRVPATGGAATLFASDPSMTFPNGLVFRDDGSLLVTDSAAGAVYLIGADGSVSPWIVDASLEGQFDYCGPGLGTFDIGANGIALAGGAVWVANNDHGSIIKIPVLSDGSAGAPEPFVQADCAHLGGADGLLADADGSLWVAVNRQNRLAHVDAAGNVSIVAEGGVLDFPASLAFASVAGQPSLLITSFALGEALSGATPHPALVALPLPAGQ